MTPDEVAFMEDFKSDEVVVEPGGSILLEGHDSAHLYTVLSGFGVRRKSLANGKRQIISFAFPGDFLGLQAEFLGGMRHSVEARTSMRLCVFERARLKELFRCHPDRSRDLAWIASMDAQSLGDMMVTLGQRSAMQGIAWAFHRIWHRLVAVGLGRDGAVPLPFRQQDLADALGLSLVHTNKMLARLRRERICDWSEGELRIYDGQRLAEFGLVELEQADRRPIM